LAEILGKDWPCATGGWLPIRVMGIDARHHGDMVYAFARRFPQPRYGPNAIAVVADRTVVPINGEPGWEKAIDGVSSVEASKKRHGMRILHVGTGFTKQTVYNALNLHAPRHGEDYPDGYYHYPDYDLEFFEGLTAEMRHVTAGGSVKWSKKQGQERNEPLDLAGYEVAMAEICQIFRYREQNWQAIEERLAELGKAIEEGTAPKMADGSETAAKITRQVAEPAKRRETPDAVVRSSWMQNFLGG
jgi:phage terminase large subunit GpA-like protein